MPWYEQPEIFFFIVSICLSIIIILLIRELVCWYLKQNKIVKQQQKIISLLEDIKNVLLEKNYPQEESSTIQEDSPTLGDNR